MPVSFYPANHPSKPVIANEQYLKDTTPLTLLKSACYDQYEKSDEILQSSFEHLTEPILPCSNGLVNTIVGAYNQHHALSLRPDDVWICILTQFNFFVNANAEALRSIFVSHEGKKELTVRALGNRYNVDFGHLARLMTGEIKNNINDPSMAGWIIPEFSTTTLNDIVVSSVLMMSTMKKYLCYTYKLRCGIPKVTLEGEKADWEDLLARIERLKEFGEEPTLWYNLLRPILTRFVRAFDDPNGQENIDFWNKVAHRRSMGSGGPTYLSGWITAFCAWNEDGQWIGNKPGKELSENRYAMRLSLDGTRYHWLDSKKIPAGYASVDVKLDDNGEIFDTIMVAGLVGMRVFPSNDARLSENESSQDAVKPLPGWWIFVKRDEHLPGRGKEERQKRIEEIMKRSLALKEQRTNKHDSGGGRQAAENKP
ncbi:hypothetical protein K435DRAFT_249067 [Dendrothele bispora CBS 962.96]|uniref:DUF4419 domain-containing protein n=1 Tax=Dendrothele bispora (strain CBS 962.96) TaxID=1314807 RepID=A0A4S8LN82_DENBC|nr:hypothetical protein K435DRAFT_249067 [Dendrothele bispora CBS 962.96]